MGEDRYESWPVGYVEAIVRESGAQKGTPNRMRHCHQMAVKFSSSSEKIRPFGHATYTSRRTLLTSMKCLGRGTNVWGFSFSACIKASKFSALDIRIYLLEKLAFQQMDFYTPTVSHSGPMILHFFLRFRDNANHNGTTAFEGG